MRNYLLIAAGLIAVTMVAACGGGDSAAGGGLTAEEETALGYIDGYVNAESTEKKQAYVEENIHADAQPLYSMGAGVTDGPKLKNAEVVDSMEIEENGQTSEAVLIDAEKNGEEVERIVIIHENKVGFAYESEVENVSTHKQFEELRSQFEE